MLAVIFEAIPAEGGEQEYLEVAAELHKSLEGHIGFISLERFQSLADENKILSLSFWEDEESISAWRNKVEHRQAQKSGRERFFSSYRIRVARVGRDYTSDDRLEAPSDSNADLLL
jgi:heme-degrading monooxygenase HmoA